MTHFVPSRVPPEGAGVQALFQLVERAVPSYFAPDHSVHIARAPGRIEVMGRLGHAAGSLVVKLPLADSVSVAVQLRDDDQMHAFSPVRDGSRGQHVTCTLADLGLPDAPLDYATARERFRRVPADSWSAYVLGAALVLVREHGVRLPRGAAFLVRSDLPERRGLGSSTALATAALSALAAACGVPLDSTQLTELAFRVEFELTAKSLGRTDPWLAATGEENELQLARCAASEPPRNVPLPEQIEFVGVTTGSEPVDAAARPDTDDHRVERFIELLAQPPSPDVFCELGDLMFEAHAADAGAGLSSAQADFAVEQVRSMRGGGRGVWGARLSGRGGVVAILGERGKVWLETLRIKKQLGERFGIAPEIFRWSSGGALGFGSIEMRPRGAGGGLPQS